MGCPATKQREPREKIQNIEETTEPCWQVVEYLAIYRYLNNSLSYTYREYFPHGNWFVITHTLHDLIFSLISMCASFPLLIYEQFLHLLLC